MLKQALPFVTISLALTAVASAGAAEVKYMLWDSNQLPAYQQCAVDFQKAKLLMYTVSGSTGSACTCM